MNIHDLRAAFALTNVRAFYAVVRHTESSNDDTAYTLVNLAAPNDPQRGVYNHHFIDFAKHPYDGLKTTQGGYAAGAPQFIPTTWGELKAKYGFTDFSPPNQDLGYVGCLVKRDALDDVIAGRFDTAVQKCLQEWSSLPNAAESNANWTMEKARALYQKHGGSFSPGTTATKPPQEKPMGALALLQLFGPILSGLIPQIASFLKPGSEVAQRNIGIAQTIVDTITKTTESPNLQAAVEKMQADPTVAKAVQQAVITQPEIIGVMEIGGGIKASREFGLAVQNADKPFWFNPTFWITLGLLPMMYMIAASVLFTMAPDPSLQVGDLAALSWYQKVGFDANTRTGALNLIIGFIFGGIVGVWFGTSYGSQRKTELAAEADGRRS